jgi:cysteine desulfurase / selenocysteine lyase
MHQRPEGRLSAEFGPFSGRVWLNSAHQGPLPRCAIPFVTDALERKLEPHRIDDDSFVAVPARLKAALSRLLSTPVEEIILGNSTSYGLHLLANGIPLQADDEVLLAEGDFPATILPWCGLQARGVRVRFVPPGEASISRASIEPLLTRRTRVVCLSWVNSFTGVAIDLEAIGELCRSHQIWFVVNGSQAVGTRALDLSRAPVDAIVACGFKWLCGPYGTGFCWVRSALLDQLEYNQRYWLPELWRTEHAFSYRPGGSPVIGAERYDVFCTANFLNVAPWTAAIEHLLDVGIERIQTHNDGLAATFLDALDRKRFRVVSPSGPEQRSSIVAFSSVEPGNNPHIHRQLAQAGIDIALRRGDLRVSPHLFNGAADIAALLGALGESR